MVTLLLFGIALLIAVMFSGIAERSALFIAAIFLLIGFIAGQGAIGVIIPWVIMSLNGTRLFSVSALYTPLLGLTIALLVFSTTKLAHANAFLAAFFAGVTIASMDKEKNYGR